MAADPRPANDSAPIRPSLFDRAVEAARRDPTPPPAPRAPRPPIDRLSALLAVAIVATPLLTWGGAAILTARAQDEGRAIARRAAPVMAEQAAAHQAHTLLQQAWRGAPLGTTCESLARALPPDAALLRAERNAAGMIAIEVAALPGFADNLRKLKQLGYTDLVLVGHSAGGLVARHFVEDYPDAGVTKVVQVCTPNGGSFWANFRVGVRKSQRAFLGSLTRDGREQCLRERGDKRIPPSVDFVCLVGNRAGEGDAHPVPLL